MTKQSITLRRTDTLADDLEQLREAIRGRAYEIFLSRNGSNGSDLDDWLLAEQELVVRPAVELRQRDGHIELDAVVTPGDPTELDVRVGPQDILISSRADSSQEMAGAHTLFGSVHLPMRIDPSSVEAEWRDGLLHLTAAVANEAATAMDIRPSSES